MKIKESITGYYFYHLADEDSYISRCGKVTVMNANIPLEEWGITGHLNEKWCKECEKLLKC